VNWLVIVILLASAYGGFHWYTTEQHEHVAPGIIAPGEPAQQSVDAPQTFQAKGYTFEVRARYEITARVLRKEIYRIDGGASLAPVDLGLGWGRMSDTAIVDQLEFSQMGRFLYWKPRDWMRFPLSPQETLTHAAQVHSIPADDKVESRLRKLRPGQLVTLTGYLVDVRGPNGFRWSTSLRRDDTGDGACEIMWIEQVSVS